MFTLRTRNQEFDDYLILSFNSETHVLFINGEELVDTQITGRQFCTSYASFADVVLASSFQRSINKISCILPLIYYNQL